MKTKKVRYQGKIYDVISVSSGGYVQIGKVLERYPDGEVKKFQEHRNMVPKAEIEFVSECECGHQLSDHNNADCCGVAMCGCDCYEETEGV